MSILPVKVPEKTTEFSFRRGMNQLKMVHVPQVKFDIMKALDITSRSNWHRRLNGEVEPKITEVKAIEAIFNCFGITDIWGA